MISCRIRQGVKLKERSPHVKHLHSLYRRTESTGTADQPCRSAPQGGEHSNTPARSTNGGTVPRRSLSTETCGFTSTIKKAATPLILSAGSITRPTRKRWNIFWVAVRYAQNISSRCEGEEAFELPPKNDNMRRAFAYLTITRGVDKDVLQAFADRNIVYESADYHNAVFIGYDRNGVPAMRTSEVPVRQTPTEETWIAVPEYSFHWHGSDKLYLFEAPIDMLSFISMHKEHWKTHSYAAACCISSRVLHQMMKDNSLIKEVYLCLDNDSAGQIGNKRISEELKNLASRMKSSYRSIRTGTRMFCIPQKKWRKKQNVCT